MTYTSTAPNLRQSFQGIVKQQGEGQDTSRIFKYKVRSGSSGYAAIAFLCSSLVSDYRTAHLSCPRLMLGVAACTRTGTDISNPFPLLGELALISPIPRQDACAHPIRPVIRPSRICLFYTASGSIGLGTQNTLEVTSASPVFA